LKYHWKFFVLILIVSAPLLADLPLFWLDAPKGRPNAHDPKSPLLSSRRRCRWLRQ